MHNLSIVYSSVFVLLIQRFKINYSKGDGYEHYDCVRYGRGVKYAVYSAEEGKYQHERDKADNILNFWLFILTSVYIKVYNIDKYKYEVYYGYS